jgi:phage terminase Nu1 subunit (DNA packaging protein)
MECTGPDLGELFGVSVQTIAELAKKGIVIRLKKGVYDRDQSTRNYIGHLRQTAAGRGGKDKVESLAEERTRLASEQADNMALKNAALRNEVVPLAEVKQTWSQWASEVRAAFLALPGRIQQRIVGLSVSDVSIIDEEVRAILTDLVKVDVPEPSGEA